jgi:hypothetical protein
VAQEPVAEKQQPVRCDRSERDEPDPVVQDAPRARRSAGARRARPAARAGAGGAERGAGAGPADDSGRAAPHRLPAALGARPSPPARGST